MERKAVLFKRFAGIDCFDIEVDETHTHVHAEPIARHLADTIAAAPRQVRRFGLAPYFAFCQGSQFGNLDGRFARAALPPLGAKDAAFGYGGEMHTDAALDPEFRERLFPGHRLTGRADTPVSTSTDAAGTSRNRLKAMGDGLAVGPIPMGMGNRARIVTPGVSVRAGSPSRRSQGCRSQAAAETAETDRHFWEETT